MKEGRTAEDGSTKSYLVEGENGRVYLCHKAHIKHRHIKKRECTSYTPSDNKKKLRFALHESAKEGGKRRSARLAKK